MVRGGVRLSRDGAVVSPHTSIRPCRCGPLLQLCHGPLLRHTGLIVALRILTVGLDVGQRRGGTPRYPDSTDFLLTPPGRARQHFGEGSGAASRCSASPPLPSPAPRIWLLGSRHRMRPP